MVDDRYVEHARAGEWLRVLRDGEGRSVGTARTYAGRIALYLTWAVGARVDALAPSVEELAAFARWLERTPSRKHRAGPDRRLAPAAGVVTMTTDRSPGTNRRRLDRGGRVRPFRRLARLDRAIPRRGVDGAVLDERRQLVEAEEPVQSRTASF